MAVGTGASFTADFSEVRKALSEFIDAKQALNAVDPLKGVKGYSPTGTRMERELRKRTREMSKDVILPALQQSAASTGSPFIIRIANTARAVNDRLPIVKVGYVQPVLSGWKYVKQANRKAMKGTLAYGSEYGPKGGHKSGPLKDKGVNFYNKRPRNERGYWVTPAMQSARVTRGIIQGYSDVVNAIFRDFGVNKRVGGGA